jgi:hypothetical protein
MNNVLRDLEKKKKFGVKYELEREMYIASGRRNKPSTVKKKRNLQRFISKDVVDAYTYRQYNQKLDSPLFIF